MDLLDHQELIRVANLANSVLVALRQPARGRYESERALASFLSAAGHGSPVMGIFQPSPQLEHASSYLSRQIHRDGTQTRYQVERMLAGMRWTRIAELGRVLFELRTIFSHIHHCCSCSCACGPTS